MPRADRLFALVQLLLGSRYKSLAELTEELETTPRTLYRDLADLELRGVPVERVDGSYRIAATSSVRSLPLTDHERFLLAVVLDHPSFGKQPAYASSLKQLRAKLTAAHALQSSVVARSTGPDRSGCVPADVVSALEKSIRDSHSISILYTSLNGRGKRWRGIDPWLMVHRSEAWYLLGRCHTHDEPRTFRLDRIEAVLPIGVGFSKPEHFDPDQWFANSWGVFAGDEPREVMIQFDADVAPLIEHAQHHPNEAKRVLEDGSIEYRAVVGPLDEIARWICGFGGAAHVLTPDALIVRVREIAQGAAAAHRPRARAAAMTRRAPS